MKEYIVSAILNGEECKLLILYPIDGCYKVYWDAQFLGTIEPINNEFLGQYWDTDSKILEGCCQDIGEYIESCD